MSKNLTFRQQIYLMNAMYKLPAADYPTLQAIGEPVFTRLSKFKKTLADEVDELDAIMNLAMVGQGAQDGVLDTLVAIADLLGDIIVYCRSEALKFGIPLEQVLDIIMLSNASKLGADGKPIYDENGKFLKGPNYWKPEPRIKQCLQEAINNHLKERERDIQTNNA